MRILLLGATGSIGQTFLKLKQDYELVGISYYKNYKLAYQIIDEFKVNYYYSPISNNKSNVKDINELIKLSQPDLVINAISGLAGVEYTFITILNNINIALANKESLVVAGKFINEIINKNNITLKPIDSEHTSLMELLEYNSKNVKNLYITCSGGRYYNLEHDKWKNISYEEAVIHPNWKMGSKISIDSATLMNKCFEIVEAYYLFKTKNIRALYHPQSIIHSIIQFEDNSYFANMSRPDMALAINVAIFNDNKSSKNSIKPLVFENLNLTLSEIDEKKWKPIKWAYDIINDKNNCLGLIIIYANEVAIELFKNGKIHLNSIYDVIDLYINAFKENSINSIYDLAKLYTKLNEFNILDSLNKF